MTPAAKNLLAKFIIGGAFGLLVSKFQDVLNEKTDERWPMPKDEKTALPE